MRILHIDTGHEMRGGQWQVLHLMQGLAQRRVISSLLAPAGSELFRAARSAGLDARPLNPWTAPLVARGFDLLHVHDARAHSLSLLCPRPVLVSRRVGFPVRSRWKYARATHYLAISEYVRGTLLKAGVDAARISIVYDGVRVPEPLPSGDRDLIVALDSDDPGKGQALIQQLGFPICFSRNLIDDLPRAAVFLYISELEGLGSAALLAMAYGAAVVASRVGGLPEIVRDDETGVLTSNDPAAIRAAVSGLMGDARRRARLAAAGRQMVEQRFTVERMVEDTMQVYQRLKA